MEQLEREDPRLVALIEMRFFAGMTAEETAEVRSESVHAIRHDLRYAQPPSPHHGPVHSFLNKFSWRIFSGSPH